jgi:hypothetical protein
MSLFSTVEFIHVRLFITIGVHPTEILIHHQEFIQMRSLFTRVFIQVKFFISREFINVR